MPGGNQLHAGTLVDFDTVDNMAKEIETAYDAVRRAAPPLGGGIADPLPSGDSGRDRRMLFIAVAAGVINHLKNNPHAFHVTVRNGAAAYTGDVTDLSVLP